MTLRPRRRIAALVLVLGLTGAAPARADGVTDGNQGRQALLEGRLDEAIRLFSRAIDFGVLTASNQATTLGLRGSAYLQKGRTAVALEDLNESLRLAETPDSYFTRAKIFIAQSRYDDAVADLTRALALNGAPADLYALRGYAQLYAGRLEAALKDEDQSIALTPGDGFAYRTRGHAFLNLGQDDKAIADETRAIALDPMDNEARWLRAYAWRNGRRNLAKALADYDAALATDPQDANARASRGDAYEQMGRAAEAAADYDAVIRLNPQDPAGYLARGRLRLIQGRPAAAVGDLARALSLRPTDPYALIWLHLARAKTGAADAADLRAKAIRIAADAWPAPVIDYLTGRADAAAVLARVPATQARAQVHPACEANLFIGEDALAKGRRAAGLERLQAAVRACPSDSREARLARSDLAESVPAPPHRPKPAAADRAGRKDLRGRLP